jgi:hypothetical protein
MSSVREICSPELSATELEQVLAELDALCRQARELSAALRVQMADQRRQQYQVIQVRHHPNDPAA